MLLLDRQEHAVQLLRGQGDAQAGGGVQVTMLPGGAAYRLGLVIGRNPRHLDPWLQAQVGDRRVQRRLAVAEVASQCDVSRGEVGRGAP